MSVTLYTETDLAAFTTRVSCCASNQAYKALKAKRAGSSQYKCIYNKHLYLQQALCVLGDYTPLGTIISPAILPHDATAPTACFDFSVFTPGSFFGFGGYIQIGGLVASIIDPNDLIVTGTVYFATIDAFGLYLKNAIDTWAVGGITTSWDNATQLFCISSNTLGTADNGRQLFITFRQAHFYLLDELITPSSYNNYSASDGDFDRVLGEVVVTSKTPGSESVMYACPPVPGVPTTLFEDSPYEGIKLIYNYVDSEGATPVGTGNYLVLTSAGGVRVHSFIAPYTFLGTSNPTKVPALLYTSGACLSDYDPSTRYLYTMNDRGYDYTDFGNVTRTYTFNRSFIRRSDVTTAALELSDPTAIDIPLIHGTTTTAYQDTYINSSANGFDTTSLVFMHYLATTSVTLNATTGLALDFNTVLVNDVITITMSTGKDYIGTGVGTDVRIYKTEPTRLTNYITGLITTAYNSGTGVVVITITAKTVTGATTGPYLVDTLVKSVTNRLNLTTTYTIELDTWPTSAGNPILTKPDFTVGQKIYFKNSAVLGPDGTFVFLQGIVTAFHAGTYGNVLDLSSVTFTLTDYNANSDEPGYGGGQLYTFNEVNNWIYNAGTRLLLNPWDGSIWTTNYTETPYGIHRIPAGTANYKVTRLPLTWTGPAGGANYPGCMCFVSYTIDVTDYKELWIGGVGSGLIDIYSLDAGGVLTSYARTTYIDISAITGGNYLNIIQNETNGYIFLTNDSTKKLVIIDPATRLPMLDSIVLSNTIIRSGLIENKDTGVMFVSEDDDAIGTTGLMAAIGYTSNTLVQDTTLSGGEDAVTETIPAIIVEEDDGTNCLTQDEMYTIIENVKKICGCCCEFDDDVLQKDIN